MTSVPGLVTVGAGFTATVTEYTAPGQPNADVGVTEYVTFCGMVAEELVIVLVIEEVLCAVKLSPVVEGLSAAVQL